MVRSEMVIWRADYQVSCAIIIVAGKSFMKNFGRSTGIRAEITKMKVNKRTVFT